MLKLEFCGDWFDIEVEKPFYIGREGVLELDDNPYLHRRFLRIMHREELWWIENIGSRLSATLADAEGNTQAWVSPGARLPLVYARTMILFTAGPTTYEVNLLNSEPIFAPTYPEPTEVGETTIGPVRLTASQHLLILALAEGVLSGRGTAAIPTSAEAAGRLGWSLTKFNRKLDNVCEKLDRQGVRGLRGGQRRLAVNRRARLVEHAVASRMVDAGELGALDDEGDRATSGDGLA